MHTLAALPSKCEIAWPAIAEAKPPPRDVRPLVRGAIEPAQKRFRGGTVFKTQICSLKKRRRLTARYLRTILDYDPETGVFRWRERTDVGRSWNTRYAGKIAGCADRRRGGAPTISINKRDFAAARLAFLYMTGRWPKNETDHRDGRRANNAWANLREATSRQNRQKRCAQSNSRSGVKGVTWRADKRKWRATIERDHLGYFDSAAEAEAAYRAAALERFGEFALAA